jgi:hypothetical protein
MDKININTSPANVLTQLPGISIDLASNIVNRRERHGLFTAWEELLAVKNFPESKLDAIKERAILRCSDDLLKVSECAPPRHLDKIKILERSRPHSAVRRARIHRKRVA